MTILTRIEATRASSMEVVAKWVDMRRDASTIKYEERWMRWDKDSGDLSYGSRCSMMRCVAVRLRIKKHERVEVDVCNKCAIPACSILNVTPHVTSMWPTFDLQLKRNRIHLKLSEINWSSTDKICVCHLSVVYGELTVQRGPCQYNNPPTRTTKYHPDSINKYFMHQNWSRRTLGLKLWSLKAWSEIVEFKTQVHPRAEFFISTI